MSNAFLFGGFQNTATTSPSGKPWSLSRVRSHHAAVRRAIIKANKERAKHEQDL